MARTRTRVLTKNVRILQVRTAQELSKRGAESIQARARRFAPKDTGALAESIIVIPVSIGVQTRYKVVVMAKHGRYQEFGTGPIHAKPGGVLRFRAGGQVVFARSTRGVPAVHFMRRAAESATLADFA